MPSRRWVLRYTTWSLPASFAVNHARIGGTILKGGEITGIATIKWLGCLRRCWAMLLPTLMDVFVERKLLRCKTSVWIAAICPRRWSSRRLLMSFVIRTTDIAYCKANSEEEHYDHDYYKYHNSPHFDYFWHEGMKYIWCFIFSMFLFPKKWLLLNRQIPNRHAEAALFVKQRREGDDNGMLWTERRGESLHSYIKGVYYALFWRIGIW